MRIRPTDQTSLKEIRNIFPYLKENAHTINMKPEGTVFIYNPLENNGFYGRRKCEGFFQGTIEFTKTH